MLVKFVKEIILIRRCMGWGFTFEYLVRCLVNLSDVIRLKSLWPVDTSFDSGRIMNVRFKGLNIKITAEMLPTTREIFLKDCYRFDVAQKYQVVMDLGANRGNFSVAAAKCANLVIAVECEQTEMPKKFVDTMRLNGQSNYIFENAFIDADSALESHISVSELMKKYGINHIDFMKIDIEGAEKLLFNNDAVWLNDVDSLSMEIHPCFGVDMYSIGTVLKNFDFSVQVVDLEMNPINLDTPATMANIYATKA